MVKLSWLVDFYACESLSDSLSRTRFNRAADKLKAQIDNQQDIIIENLAPAMFDYIVFASLGEARHAHERAELAIEEVYSGSRDSVFYKADRFDPVRALEACVTVFESDWWDGGYGGMAWAQIAQTGLEYANGDLDAKTFIDVCASLQHNNGSMFGKGCIIDADFHGLMQFLDLKFQSHNLAKDLLIDWVEYVPCLSPYTRLYLKKYARMINVTFPDWESHKNPRWQEKPGRLEYTPVEYGSLTPTIVDAGGMGDCDHCNEAIMDEDDLTYDESGCYMYHIDCYYSVYQICRECDCAVFISDFIYDLDLCVECAGDDYEKCSYCNKWFEADALTRASHHKIGVTGYSGSIIHYHLCDVCLDVRKAKQCVCGRWFVYTPDIPIHHCPAGLRDREYAMDPLHTQKYGQSFFIVHTTGDTATALLSTGPTK